MSTQRHAPAKAGIVKSSQGNVNTSKMRFDVLGHLSWELVRSCKYIITSYIHIYIHKE